MPDAVISLLAEFSRWLTTTRFSQALAAVNGSIPTLQTVHILAVAAVLSCAAIMNLRVLGLFGTDRPVIEVFPQFVRTIWVGLVVLLTSGLLLIVMEPARSLLGWPFQLKMAMLLAVIILTVISHRAAVSVTGSTSTHVGLRIMAATALVLWLAIVVAGRWIAYV